MMSRNTKYEQIFSTGNIEKSILKTPKFTVAKRVICGILCAAPTVGGKHITHASGLALRAADQK